MIKTRRTDHASAGVVSCVLDAIKSLKYPREGAKVVDKLRALLETKINRN